MNQDFKRCIPYTKPSITELEIDFANDAVRNGWGNKCYEYIEKFEFQFKNFLGTKYAVATSSCTGALHMGLSALGIKDDDEVILADTNWVASLAPIVHLGAKAKFVDILKDTWCIDPKEVEKAITSKTKAILAVHLYGNLCELDELQDIAKHYGIPIIEDSAEALGSKYHGRYAGSLGTFGTFSFHGTKTMTTGEGGIFVCDEKQLYEKVLTLSNHGRGKDQSKQFWPDMIGFKYKMSNVQAAIGCAQLMRINELINRKREIFNLYFERLKNLPLTMNPEKNDTVNGYWMPTIVLDYELGVKRDSLIAILKEKGVDARVFFWPLSSTKVAGEKAFDKLYIAEEIFTRAINLPSYHNILEDDIDYICKIISKYVKSLSIKKSCQQ